MNILFIEDEEQARCGLMALLVTVRSHDVDVAEDADEAVQAMRENAYDLLLLDIMIPGGEVLKGVPFREAGKELALRLRRAELGNLKTREDVGIVAITAVSNMDVLQALNGEGNLRILQKPIDPEDALGMIDEFAGWRKGERI